MTSKIKRISDTPKRKGMARTPDNAPAIVA
jgi:hypothetical protein